MDSRAIRPGDRVLCDVKGVQFVATVVSKQPRNVHVYPDDPIRHTWRHLSPRQVVRRLERPKAKEHLA